MYIQIARRHSNPDVFNVRAVVVNRDIHTNYMEMLTKIPHLKFGTMDPQLQTVCM